MTRIKRINIPPPPPKKKKKKKKREEKEEKIFDKNTKSFHRPKKE